MRRASAFATYRYELTILFDNRLLAVASSKITNVIESRLADPMERRRTLTVYPFMILGAGVIALRNIPSADRLRITELGEPLPTPIGSDIASLNPPPS
jgi:hypothetical protein